MNGSYCKDAVLRAVKLHEFLRTRDVVTVKQTAKHLECTGPCARKWLNAASLVLPITERILDNDTVGRPAIGYELLPTEIEILRMIK
jgi:hypothetical protein